MKTFKQYINSKKLMTTIPFHLIGINEIRTTGINPNRRGWVSKTTNIRGRRIPVILCSNYNSRFFINPDKDSKDYNINFKKPLNEIYIDQDESDYSGDRNDLQKYINIVDQVTSQKGECTFQDIKDLWPQFNPELMEYGQFVKDIKPHEIINIHLVTAQGGEGLESIKKTKL